MSTVDLYDDFLTASPYRVRFMKKVNLEEQKCSESNNEQQTIAPRELDWRIRRGRAP